MAENLEDWMDRAELTLLFQEVKYRDPNGEEKTAMNILPFGRLKYAGRGEEQVYVVPVHIGYEGQDPLEPLGGLRIFLEPYRAVREDDAQFFGGI